MAPRIVITVGDPSSSSAAPGEAEARNARYADAVARHGAAPVLLSPAIGSGDRARLLSDMDGLLLAGGPDIDPARHGAQPDGAREIDGARDELEAEAWAAAERRGIAVLGICRGFQAINVFSGGRLLQDVRGHAAPAGHGGPDLTHPLRVVPGTRLARILFPTNVRGGVVEVNTSHHQAVRPADLAPGLLSSATASSPAGELVEALETRAAGRFVVGIQSHPERRDSTPPAFERLFRVFVDASRGALTSR